MSKEELDQQGLDPKPDSGSSQPRGEQKKPPVAYTQKLGDYQIETREGSEPENQVDPTEISDDMGKMERGKRGHKQKL